MPTLAQFYGVTITMMANDHPPPHFHAEYAEFEAIVSLDGRFLRGRLPPRAAGLVLEWALQHGPELAAAWAALRAGRHPGKIDPLP